MIEPLADLPDGVIGFEAVGEVHADDYTGVLIPAVDAAAAAGGVRLVYVLGERFTGYSVGAGFEDARLGLGHLHAWTGWVRTRPTRRRCCAGSRR